MVHGWFVFNWLLYALDKSYVHLNCGYGDQIYDMRRLKPYSYTFFIWRWGSFIPQARDIA